MTAGLLNFDHSTGLTGRGSGGNGKSAAWRASRIAPWFAVPAVSMVILSVVLPTFLVLAMSFFSYNPYSGTFSPAGLKNYEAVVSNGELVKATVNTTVYTVLTVPTTIAFGLLIALGIHGVSRGAALWRTVYFLPVASTLAAMSIVWQFWYYPRSGLIDRTLGQLIGVQDWLHSTTWALPALAVVGNWQGLGTAVIIFLAGIAGVPGNLQEAARMDGASGWSRFWHVTWPAIRPATLAATILTSRSSLSMFDQVKVMTQGGPVNSTETLGFALYRRGFSYVDIGGGAVLTIALLALLLAVALLQLVVLGRRRSVGAVR